MFSLLYEDKFYIGGVKIDINPITVYKNDTLEEYLPGVEKYLEEKRQMVSEREKLKEKKEKVYEQSGIVDKGNKMQSKNVS